MFLYFFRRNWRFEYKQNSRSGGTPPGILRPVGFLPLREFVRSKAPSATNHLAVHAELTQFLFRLLFGQEVDAVDTLFFGRLHIHQRIIQENALICL